MAFNPPCSCIPSTTPPPDSRLVHGLSLFDFSLSCSFVATILPAISTALVVTMADDDDVDEDDDDDDDGDNFFFLRGGWPPQEVPVDAPKLVSLSILRNFTKRKL